VARTKVNPNTRPITQHDVAAEAGCSQNTVALALRNSPRISEKRRDQIQRIARKLGYRPNLAARSLRQRRSGLIGVFCGSMDDVRAEYVRSLIAELHSTDYKPMFGIDPSLPSPWYDAPWIETFRMFQVEALVALSWHDRTEVPSWHKDIPLVLAGCQPQKSVQCDSVSLDRADAGITATKYLLEKGHRKIEMLSNTPKRTFTEGYKKAMKDAGLTPKVSVAEQKSKPTEDFAAELLSRKDRPSALIVLNSRLAARLCTSLINGGLRVPEDVAVVGYDRLTWADDAAVPLTTIEQPVPDVVAKTVELTRRRVTNPDEPPEQIKLKHVLIPRASA